MTLSGSSLLQSQDSVITGHRDGRSEFTVEEVPSLYRLDSPSQTLVVASLSGGIPEVLHWGAVLPLDEDLAQLVAVSIGPLGQQMLDERAPLSLSPERGWAWPGHAGLIGSKEDGSGWVGQFRLVEAVPISGGYDFRCKDEIAALELSLIIQLDQETNVLEVRARVTNLSGSPYRVDWLSAPVLPVSDTTGEMIAMDGRWCREFTPRREKFPRGQYVRESRYGRTSHENFPGFFALSERANEGSGEVFGFHLGWSGNHRLVAEEVSDGRRAVHYGVLSEPGEILLAEGQSYTTPTLYATWSDAGLNGCSHAFHDHVRRRILSVPQWYQSRPVHYNCWEAVYFDHNPEQLTALAQQAAGAGAELFVLDDGWFPGRHDDTAGLGDWEVDHAKHPEGLTPLIDAVHQAGMRFGLWFEPEMVNEQSVLYRLHPDWVLNVPGYKQIEGRNQLVLDITRKEVADYLFERMDTLLKTYEIDYIKWDMNRPIILAGSKGGHPVSHAHVLAVYALLDQLRSAHPELVIESCSAGGGRIDFEILKRTDRVWLSDSNDAHERWRMQHFASLFLPKEVVGSHVGPAICHTSGRRLSMGFRGAVAATAHMGIEADLFDVDGSDLNELMRATIRYKSWRDLLFSGRMSRLDHAEPNSFAHIVVSADGRRFLTFAGQLDTQDVAGTRRLRLTDLDPEGHYRIALVLGDENLGALNRLFVSPLLDPEGAILSGATLMGAGVSLPIAMPDTVWILEGCRIDKEEVPQ
ncbi:MAG: alpha-galactosidase [Stappiaceae bacterium]